MGKWLEGRQEEAKKILGDKADFPAEKPDMSKLEEEYGKKTNKVFMEFFTNIDKNVTDRSRKSAS